MLFYILAFADIGSTFLDWSLHHLAGNDTHWSRKENKWVNLCKNPLTKNNAHHHKPNTMRGLKEIDEFMSSVLNFQHEKGKLYSFYLHPLEEPRPGITNPARDWKEFLPVVCKNHKLIYLFDDASYNPLIVRGNLSLFKGLDLLYKKDRNILLKIRLSKIFGEEKVSKKIETNGKMRNFIFFNMKNLQKNLPVNLKSFKLANFYPVNYETLINFPESTIRKIFNFLNLELDEKRLGPWHTIHLKWQKFLIPKIIFDRDIDKICYHIKNGLNFDLEKYELDVFQEALIMQHFLKYYNRVLKVGSLDHFPNDTIELKNYF
jgi:hypothetical protein